MLRDVLCSYVVRPVLCQCHYKLATSQGLDYYPWIQTIWECTAQNFCDTKFLRIGFHIMNQVGYQSFLEGKLSCKICENLDYSGLWE